MKQGKIDFSVITACGECCADCWKQKEGLCAGCREADGYVPEWTESGRCKIHACAKEHKALFCGLCTKFPCEKAESLMPWKRNCLEELSDLAKQYRSITEQKANCSAEKDKKEN